MWAHGRLKPTAPPQCLGGVAVVLDRVDVVVSGTIIITYRGRNLPCQSERLSTSACRQSTNVTQQRTSRTSSDNTLLAGISRSCVPMRMREERTATGRPRRPYTAHRGCDLRPGRLHHHSGLRREPMGSLPRPRRGRALRIHLQEGRHQGPILRGAVRERRQSGLHHRQGRQTRHGRGVQSRAIGKGIRRSMPPDRTWVPSRRTAGLWVAPLPHRSEFECQR